MKVGILTHPLHGNYGGILQAWAMQRILKKRGYKVETFDIRIRLSRGRELIAAFNRLILKILRRYEGPIFCEYAMRRYWYGIRQDLLSFIKKNISLKRYDTIKDIPSGKYDIILVGSDQVWRDIYISYLFHTHDCEDVFLYNIAHSSRKVAYAASLGVDAWSYSTTETERIRQALSRFYAVSVRETSGVKLLAEHASCNAQWVLDPTMLVDADEYRDLYKKKEVGAKYKDSVVSYILDSTPDKENLIKRVALSLNVEMHELKRAEDVRQLSIEEWLYAIDQARIIVTDSFHGCVFSIIFRKPLIFVMNQDRGNARFDSLIEKFKLGNNLVTTSQDLEPDKDYHLPSDIDILLRQYRDESQAFLDKALS